jgi:DNA-binding PadR family transcriptional regulator
MVRVSFRYIAFVHERKDTIMENTYHHHDECNGDLADRLRRAHHGMRGGFGPFGGRGHGRGGFGGGRARRGDVREGVLRLLAEQPMHGYQIIQELSSRSGGAWSPSAGSVYPTLQLLEDEGLVVAQESGGKRVYSLTDAGRSTVAELAQKPAPWEEAASADTGGDLRAQMPRIGAAVWQIAMTGDADRIARAAEILNDARKKLYAILAED